MNDAMMSFDVSSVFPLQFLPRCRLLGVRVSTRLNPLGPKDQSSEELLVCCHSKNMHRLHSPKSTVINMHLSFVKLDSFYH